MPNTSRLVSFQDFEDSSCLNCALPYATQQGTNFNTSLSKGNYLLEAGLLEQGWIVSIPDYEGPKAVFPAGPQSGMPTLDSIRAVLKSSNLTGIANKDVAVTIWGGPGGTHPTEWAAEMQSSYAPQLKIEGAAIRCTIANLNNTVLAMNRGFWAESVPVGILGLYHAYETPELTELLSNETFPENRTEFLDAQEQYGVTEIARFAFQDFGRYLRTGLERALNLPQIKELVEEAGIMGK